MKMNQSETTSEANRARLTRRGGRVGITQRSPVLNHGGKSGVCAKKQRVLTWGDPVVGVGDWKSAEVGVVSD